MSYDANDGRLWLFVSGLNSQLKRSSHNLTLPAVHFCPITSPHLAQQESAGHEYIAFCFVSCCFFHAGNRCEEERGIKRLLICAPSVRQWEQRCQNMITTRAPAAASLKIESKTPISVILGEHFDLKHLFFIFHLFK